MRRKHHPRLKHMGQTPSLIGLEQPILLYLHGDFERSDEEIIVECYGIEQESAKYIIRSLVRWKFINRTKEEEFLFRSDCWLIPYCREAGAQAMGVHRFSDLSIIPDKSSRIRHDHEHERHHHRSGGARTDVFSGQIVVGILSTLVAVAPYLLSGLLILGVIAFFCK